LSKPLRIFIGLTEIAGYFGGLREGFERLGFEVDQINESADPYGYGGRSRGAALGAAAEQVYRFGLTTSGARGWLARPARWGLGAARLPHRLIALEHALRTCDVFVFGGGGSFIAGHDLGLIRRAGKRIVWVFTGSDHRPPYLNGKIVRERANEPETLIAEARATRRRVHRIEHYAHAIVAHGPSAQFHTRPFAEFLSVGVPVRAVPVDHATANAGPWPGVAGVRVLHCPTDPAKGSLVIRELIGRIRDRGLPVSYLELANRPNAEVRARLLQADLVIDEVFSDTPMALFATEAAVAGVPAVVGSYWARGVSTSLPAEAIPPSAFVLPDDLEQTIERLVVNESERRDLGHRAREFVAEKWRPDQVAQRILALARGDEAGVVVRDPADLTYCAGWGMSTEMRRDAVRRVLATGGREGLGLAHNPSLETLMIAGARNGQEHRA
jgi:hypothetical protein